MLFCLAFVLCVDCFAIGELETEEVRIGLKKKFGFVECLAKTLKLNGTD